MRFIFVGISGYNWEGGLASCDPMKSRVNFEVRIPTYERPEMLERGLRSLQAQDYPNWKAIVCKAIVCDDSLSSAAMEIIEFFSR